MKITLVSGADQRRGTEQREPKAVGVERWYDRYERAWVLRYIDADGHQVGTAEYIGNGRKAADIVEKQMKESL